MQRRRQILLVLVTVFGCIGCDQSSKAVAEQHLPRNEVISFAGDTLRLQYAENPGAFLGLGDELPDHLRSFLLTGVVGVLLGAWLLYLLRARTASRVTLVACALMCGGGFGNLIDRASRSGLVIDFLNCGIGRVRTGIFNVADLAITLGAVVLIVASWRRRSISAPSVEM